MTAMNNLDQGIADKTGIEQNNTACAEERTFSTA